MATILIVEDEVNGVLTNPNLSTPPQELVIALPMLKLLFSPSRWGKDRGIDRAYRGRADRLRSPIFPAAARLPKK